MSHKKSNMCDVWCVPITFFDGTKTFEELIQFKFSMCLLQREDDNLHKYYIYSIKNYASNSAGLWGIGKAHLLVVEKYFH